VTVDSWGAFLQVQQKHSHGVAGTDADNIRAALLDEAAIVWILGLYQEVKFHVIFLHFLYVNGRSFPPLASVGQPYSVN